MGQLFDEFRIDPTAGQFKRTRYDGAQVIVLRCGDNYAIAVDRVGEARPPAEHRDALRAEHHEYAQFRPRACCLKEQYDEPISIASVGLMATGALAKLFKV